MSPGYVARVLSQHTLLLYCRTDKSPAGSFSGGSRVSVCFDVLMPAEPARAWVQTRVGRPVCMYGVLEPTHDLYLALRSHILAESDARYHFGRCELFVCACRSRAAWTLCSVLGALGRKGIKSNYTAHHGRHPLFLGRPLQQLRQKWLY